MSRTDGDRWRTRTFGCGEAPKQGSGLPVDGSGESEDKGSGLGTAVRGWIWKHDDPGRRPDGRCRRPCDFGCCTPVVEGPTAGAARGMASGSAGPEAVCFRGGWLTGGGGVTSLIRHDRRNGSSHRDGVRAGRISTRGRTSHPPDSGGRGQSAWVVAQAGAAGGRPAGGRGGRGLFRAAVQDGSAGSTTKPRHFGGFCRGAGSGRPQERVVRHGIGARLSGCAARRWVQSEEPECRDELFLRREFQCLSRRCGGEAEEVGGCAA